MTTISDLMDATLETLVALGGAGDAAEIDRRVAMRIGRLTALGGEADMLPEHRLHGWQCAWARKHLEAAGALEAQDGDRWAITDKGAVLVAQGGTAADRSIGNDGDLNPAIPYKAIDGPSTWQREVLAAVCAMEPAAFERLAQRLLRATNFTQVEVTGQSGDGGIDGTGVLTVALISFRVAFQCKRYAGTVGAGAIRDFRGALVGRAEKGVFITTGRYSATARREATRDGAPPIDLIDGVGLCELLKAHRLGVETELVERVSVRKPFFKRV